MLAPIPVNPSYQSDAKFAIVKVDSPVQPALVDNGPGDCYKKLIRRHGRRQLQSEVEAIASCCFTQILRE